MGPSRASRSSGRVMNLPPPMSARCCSSMAGLKPLPSPNPDGPLQVLAPPDSPPSPTLLLGPSCCCVSLLPDPAAEPVSAAAAAAAAAALAAAALARLRAFLLPGRAASGS
jgi:hypothetical protein